MSYTLKVYLSGLCAFVWNDKLKRYRVVLVNARVAQDPHGNPIDKHVAAFYLDKNNWKNFTSPGNVVKYEDFGVHHLVRIEGYDIQLRPKGGGPFGENISRVRNRVPPTAQQPSGNPLEQFDLHWVPKMPRIIPDHEGMKPICFEDPDPNSDNQRNKELQDLVAGRFTIKEGTVQVERLIGGPAGRYKVYDWEPKHPSERNPLAHVLAGRVEWSLKNLAVPTEIVLTPFGEPANEVAVVEIAPWRSEKSVEVSVENYPPTDLGSGSTVFHPCHFRAFYNLSHPSPDQSDPLPIPATPTESLSEFNYPVGRYVPCMAASFADDDSA